jgi:hypothetical protein
MYPYFRSGSTITLRTPKQQWLDGHTALMNERFELAPNVHTIQLEHPFASETYINCTVRIDTAIDNLTGQKVGDDYKLLLFSSPESAVEDGTKFYFDDNYWLVVNTNKIKSLVGSCVVRRCNNVLRWTNHSTGESLSEHCVIDYQIRTPDNKSRTDPLLPDGTIRIFGQLNEKTRKINENQRFLLGSPDNWVVYRIYGGGVNIFLNNSTDDGYSARVFEYALGKDFINENTDNLDLGIADYYKIPSDSGSPIINSVEILPDIDYLLEGDSQEFTCYVYQSGSGVGDSGSRLGDVFTFTIANSDVPLDKYVVEILGDNEFSVENLSMYLTDPLIISCLSDGASTDGSGLLREFSLLLKGAW